MSTAIACPSCLHEHAAPVQLTAETSRHAAKRPVTPELLHLCPNCGVLLILSLHPASQIGSTA
jgi:hypothetical protein